MKRIISTALCLASCFLLCSCSLAGGRKTVLTVGKAEISSEIFAYYFDKAYTEAKQNGGDLLDTDAMSKAAVDKCLEYTAASTMFASLQLKLSASDKKIVADDAESNWLLYSSYYTAAGISKQTVAKIREVEQYRTALLLYYFGEGSEYEVTENEIEHYFDQTYVAFKALNGYLTTTDDEGNSVKLSSSEISALRTEFENKRAKIADGSTIAEVNDGQDVDSNFIAVSNSAYPEGFLKKVSELEYNKPTVIETDENIFLVIRLNAKTGDENYYKSYRTNYVEDLRGDMLTDMLVATGSEYKVVKNEKAISKTAQTVVDARNARK